MTRLTRMRRRQARHQFAARTTAASEAIKKTGNWQKILRERIAGLSWGAFSNTAGARLHPQLALPGGRWTTSADGE